MKERWPGGFDRSGMPALNEANEAARKERREDAIARLHRVGCAEANWEMVGQYFGRPNPGCNCGAKK